MVGKLLDRVRHLERASGPITPARSDETLATLRSLIETGRLDPTEEQTVYRMLMDRLGSPY
jgi:hypothetical protein